ncbi:hypothetical protein ACS0TY_013233 [Phlomoides rotata]
MFAFGFFGFGGTPLKWKQREEAREVYRERSNQFNDESSNYANHTTSGIPNFNSSRNPDYNQSSQSYIIIQFIPEDIKVLNLRLALTSFLSSIKSRSNIHAKSRGKHSVCKEYT